MEDRHTVQVPLTILPEEHDSCAIVANVRKRGMASHGNLKRTLEALMKMGHRSGEVNGEGDGCGVLTDIPRALWAKKLAIKGFQRTLAQDERFVVGHLFISPSERTNALSLMDRVARELSDGGLDLLLQQRGDVQSDALGRQGRIDEPDFWQVAALCVEGDPEEANRHLFQLQLKLEAELPVHFVSFSADSAVYKVRGTVEVLRQYYPELRNPDFLSAITIGHNRYSTNTASSFERVQPFSLLGHNGEINTIRKLREEARAIGVQLVAGGSDSQDLDRLLATLIHEHGLSLSAALEAVFPPIINEIKQYPAPIQDLYMYLREAWGHLAQGPVGLVSRYGDECVFAVDALGLRPLWFGETDKEFFFTSERGVIPLDQMIRSPKPLAPGEKIALLVQRERRVELQEYPKLQQRVLSEFRDRGIAMESARQCIPCGGPVGNAGTRGQGDAETRGHGDAEKIPASRLTAALGWSAEDLEMARSMAAAGKEPIGSLGYDGPLAALSRERQNLADYFKESVAVVTNPAIDREREIEHFSTRAVIGPRPPLVGEENPTGRRVELLVPLLLGGARGERLLPIAEERQIAHDLGSYLLEDLAGLFEGRARTLSTTYSGDETLAATMERLKAEAVSAVASGVQLLVLDDGEAFSEGRHWIDPHLAVAAVDRALREARPSGWANPRRRAGLVLRSGAIRNLHDLMLALGMGANAVNPYLLLELAGSGYRPSSEFSVLGSAKTDGESQNPEPRTQNPELLQGLCGALRVGIEKVISTIGIHEVRGYTRLFSAIGLSPDLAAMLEIHNYYGTDGAGLGWERLEAESRGRYPIVRGEPQVSATRTYHLTPRVWRAARAVAEKAAPYSDFSEKLRELERENPVALRHLLQLKSEGAHPVAAREVDLSVDTYHLPFFIASMSFGSQSEAAYCSYAEAARRLDIICLNGEGGEVQELIGKYRRNRGQQLASGRFGVNIELANSSDIWEIKVGQGAKPGEGGYLPGAKVSAKVGAARHARPGTELISPSNNHDVYSIEDLAQLVEELKTTNPRARVIVKVPVVPGIGTIAVGIAKAGADIISLSGYDGGTGAARKHAIRHVGLPAEIGVREVHEALVRSGLRDRTEIWADGGVRSALDVLKMMMLGANRVGFGTMAMVAIGCMACRSCHSDSCPVGICTQVDSLEEAERRGIKRFQPRDLEASVRALCSFFGAMGEELRRLTAELGFRWTQNLVGRSDLLVQAGGLERLDLAALLAPVEWKGPDEGEARRAARRIQRPRNYLTKLVSSLAVELMDQGEESITYEDDKVSSSDRAFGTYLSGELTRARRERRYRFPGSATLNLTGGAVIGNGLAAFNTDGVEVVVEGGAQDGVGKMSMGGKVVVLKGTNLDGVRLDGSVGKGLAYGAQGGLFLIQGDADSRAGIRLSGADVVIGGEMRGPLDDTAGNLATRANLKGFAFEYMTDGRAVVLGDPGPWICSGMTGGAVYVRLRPEMGLDEAALRRRIAKGAHVEIVRLERGDAESVRELLSHYHRELMASHQEEEASRITADMQGCERLFAKIRPLKRAEGTTATAAASGASMSAARDLVP